MLTKNFSLFTLLLFTYIFTYAQPASRCYLADPEAGAREHNVDMQHMKLQLSFEPAKGLVKGKVLYTLSTLQKTVDTIFLDAPGIEIEKVSLDGKDAQFSTDSKGLTIRPATALAWGSTHELSITYEATPKKGIYFIGWNDEQNISRKQIWTQGQGIDNRYWIPSFDDQIDKLVTEVEVTFDGSYQVLSNGELVQEKKLKDGQKLWHYRMDQPHASYLVMVAIGKYAIDESRSQNGVSIHNWYYPEYPERVVPTYKYTSDMMDFLEAETGVKYPWGKTYSQVPVQDFIYGAMENTTATVFGDFYLIDSRTFLNSYYIGTNAHEMAHMWFGDYVTARDARHHWLQESFATHYQKHFERHIFGEDHYEWNRRRELWSVLQAAKSDNNPIVHTKAGSARHYPKGSLVLDMLRYVVGDEEYKKALTYYLKQHPYSNVDTHDFYVAFLETLGVNLEWFFEEWLYRGGEPKYEVSYEAMQTDGKQFTDVTVEQVHEMNELVGLFKMPIVFEVHYKDGSMDSRKEWIKEKKQTVRIANKANKAIEYVLFDPNSNVIKTVDFQKGIEELKAQASKAANMIDRYDALVALRDFPASEKADFLVRQFAVEPFRANRAEIIKQLINEDYTLGNDLAFAALKDRESLVREAVIDNIEKIPEEWREPFETLLKDSSYNVVESALQKLCSQYPNNAQRYLDLTSNDFGRGNEVKMTWLEMGATYVNREMYISQLVSYTGNSYEFLTRRNAFDALKRLNYLDDQLITNLFDAMLSTNRRLGGEAVSLAKTWMGQNEYKQQLSTYYAAHSWTDWERGILKEIFN